MSGVPRSQVLLTHTFTAPATSNPWSSPTGYVTLVKSAYFYNAGGAAQTFSIRVLGESFPGYVPFANVSVPSGGSSNWQGWFVLNP
ncbi:MAG TPA: hypothetical protein VH164_16300, partial [Ktedonobacteraceae bacterium]|nr:hypothetical protein [Ktedonobacteraceae bacterium]